jgi:hypothetical protein
MIHVMKRTKEFVMERILISLNAVCLFVMVVVIIVKPGREVTETKKHVKFSVERTVKYDLGFGK